MNKILFFLISISLGLGLAFSLPVASLATQVNSAPTNGLVGYWSFDEGNGTTAYDRSGNKNNGTFSGPTKPVWATGLMGKALSFGRDLGSHVSLNDSSSLKNINGSMTISAWIYVKDNVDRSTVILKGDRSKNPEEVQYWFFVDASGYLNLYAKDDTGAWQAATDNQKIITNKRWTHVSVTFLNGTASFYVDGAPVRSVALGMDSLITNSNKAYLGLGLAAGEANPSNYGDLYGLADEIRIYNRALSATEIYNLYQTGATKVNAQPTLKRSGLDAGLVNYWTMDNQDITWATNKIADLSGNSSIGTLSSFVSTSSSAVGKFGQSLKSNGASTYILNNKVINTTKSTVSSWVYLTAYPATGKLATVGGFVQGNGGNTWDKVLFINPQGKLFFYTWTGSMKCTSVPTPTISLNSWHLLTGTNDGTNNYTYIDGVQVGSIAAGNSYSGYGSANILAGGTCSVAQAICGGVTYTQTYLAANSRLDDFRVYTRALSASEVKTLYNQSAGTTKVNVPPTLKPFGLDSGLVGYWTMNNQDINWKTMTMTDKSGSGNTGTLVGLGTTTAPVAGKVGQALKFNGSSSYIEVPYTSALNTDEFTVTLWAKVTGGAGTWRSPITSRAGSPVTGYLIYAGSDNNWQFWMGTGSDWATLAGPPVKIGRWEHLVIRYKSGVMKFYVNNNLYGPLNYTLSKNTSKPLRIGAGRTEGIPTFYFNGLIDEARVYNRELSDSEILQLYRQGK